MSRLPTALLLALCLVASVDRAMASQLYPAHTDHPTGQTSIGVTVGNFNGDANPDLVVANVNSSLLTVLLGNGSGGIASIQSLATGPAPRKIATGDWNRDGLTDLAVVVGGSHTLAIHEGNGNGAFGAPTFYGGFTSAADLAAGDFNGDGFADIAVATGATPPTMILLGDGDGGFVPGTGANGSGASIVAADLNGDAVLDLVLSNRGGSAASVLFGNGDGTFDPKVDFPVGREPVSVAVGDLNRDGKPDLVTANRGGAFTPDNTVSVLLGLGGGAFSPHSDFTVNSGPEWVTIGDLDGDLRPDVAAVHVGVQGVVSVLRGNGDGTLRTREDYATGGSPRHVTAGDLNRDGKLDLATANYAENSVSVLINTGVVTSVEPTPAGAPSVRVVVAPHPVESGTRLHFQVPAGEPVTARLFDARGALVATVYDGIATNGSFDVAWDGRGAKGARLASGIYFLRVGSGSVVTSRAVVLAR